MELFPYRLFSDVITFFFHIMGSLDPGAVAMDLIARAQMEIASSNGLDTNLNRHIFKDTDYSLAKDLCGCSIANVRA